MKTTTRRPHALALIGLAWLSAGVVAEPARPAQPGVLTQQPKAGDGGVALAIQGNGNQVNTAPPKQIKKIENNTEEIKKNAAVTKSNTDEILSLLKTSVKKDQRNAQLEQENQQLKAELANLAQRLAQDTQTGAHHAGADKAVQGLTRNDLRPTADYLRQAERDAQARINKTAQDHAAARTDAAAAARQLAAITENSDTRTALAALRRATEYDPGDPENWSLLGDVEAQAGDLARAHSAYGKLLALMKEKAQAEPGNAGHLRNLSVAHNKIGEILSAQGDLPGALAAYRKGLAIRERLARQDPANAGWQRDLSVSHNKIGDILSAQGDLPGALAAYRKDLEISERLARQDPANAGWQRDLSVSHEKIGDM
ncbi:MAG: tetratricopeptide repeat protein, partial [Sulfuricellaceae bacterium]